MLSKDLDVLLQGADQVPPEAVVAAARAVAARDGLFFLRFVSTRDEADPGAAVKLFPTHLDYLGDLWRVIDEHNRVALAKSRQMLVSWLVSTYSCWWCRYRPNQAVYYQTKAWEDAVGMVAMPEGGHQGRCQFIESHLPEWLKVPHKPSEGRIQYSNGSIIQALAGGADKIRGKVASIVFEDEFAFQDDQAGVYAAVNPLIQKGAKGVFISTPNGSTNMFATLYHGYAAGDAGA